MRPSEISKIVTYYLAKNYKNLKGTMPCDRYFLIKGERISEDTYLDSIIVLGTAVDVLADAIEKEKFFGWHVHESAENANDYSNTKIFPISDGNIVPGAFKQSAALLGIEGNLERITSRIYFMNV